MSDKVVEMGNVVIPPHHQSAPKEHYADRAIQQAAEEIDAGKWIPDADPERDAALQGLGIALGLGTSGVAIGDKPALEDFRHTENFDLLGRHPRVLEALERMRGEVYNSPDPVAALEHNLALHELAEASSQSQKWDGQGRWEDVDEESRHGKILTPLQFYDILGKITGKGRLKLGEAVVRESPRARSGRVGIFMRNPAYKGQPLMLGPTKREQAIELRERGLGVMTEAKRLRAAGLHNAADRQVDLAGEMAEHAMRLLSEMEAEEEARPKEFLRVGVLQWPLGTEWMIMSFTEYGAVYKAKYLGWRTCLLTMIRAGAITEKEAHKAFPVPSGPAASWYLEQLAMLRNQRGMIDAGAV